MGATAANTIMSLAVALGLDSSELDKGLDQAEKKSTTAADVIASALEHGSIISVAALAAIAAAAVAGGTALGIMATNAIMSTAEMAHELGVLEAKTHLTAERLQELTYAGKILGVSIDSIAMAQARLSKSMYAASNSPDAQQAADFKALGVSIYGTTGKLRDSNQVLMDIFNALGKLKDPTMADAISMDLLGRGAMELAPLIEAGSKGIGALTKQAHDLGLVMSNEDVAAFDAFDEKMDAIKAGLSSLGKKFFKPLLPIFSTFADLLFNALSNPVFQTWLKTTQGKIGSFATMISGKLTEAFTKLPVLWNYVIKVATPLIDKFKKIYQAVVNLASVMLSKYGPAMRTVWGWIQANVFPIIGTLVNWILDNLPNAITTAGKFFMGFLDTVGTVWNWISANVFPIIVILYNWLAINIPKAIDWLIARWNDVKNIFDLYISPAWNILKTWLDTNIPKAVDFLKKKWDDIKNIWDVYVSPAWDTLKTWMDTNIPKAIGVLQTAWAGIQNIWDIYISPNWQVLKTWLDTNIPKAIGILQTDWANMQTWMTMPDPMKWHVLIDLIGIYFNNMILNIKTAWDNLVNDFLSSPIGQALTPTIAVLITIWDLILGIGSAIGTVLGPTFSAFFASMGPLWGQLLPAFQQLGVALQQLFVVLEPFLKVLGIVIGALLVGIIAIVTGLVNGLVQALTTLLPYISRIFGGVVEIFQGLVNAIGSYFAIIGDLLSGNFEKAQADFLTGWNSLVEVWKGIWDVVVNVLVGPLDTVLNFISGFVFGIIQFFQTLYDSLVGHSLVPDLVNDIIGWFTTLVTDVTTIVGGFIDVGAAIVDGLKTGITNGWAAFSTWLETQMTGLITSIEALFGIKSPSKVFAEIGKNITAGLTQGIGYGINVPMSIPSIMAPLLSVPAVSTSSDGRDSTSSSSGSSIPSYVVNVYNPVAEPVSTSIMTLRTIAITGAAA